MSQDHQLNIKTFNFNSFRENCYVLWDGRGNCVFVDPGCYWPEEFAKLKELVKTERLAPKAIWLTHGHFDHVHGVLRIVREYSVPVLMSPEDKMILDNNPAAVREFGLVAHDSSEIKTVDIRDGEVLDTLEGSPFRVLTTPGHTPGGVCYYDETDKVLLTGDTLFAGAIGRSDLIGGDYDHLIISIMDKLMGLPGDVDVLPGHGRKTTIADERTHNPFLQPFNEPEEDLDWDGRGNCVFVDPGCYWPEEFAKLKELVKTERLAPKAIWLTHGHFDHVHGVLRIVREYSVPVLMSPEDKMILDNNPAAVREFGLVAHDSSEIKTVDIRDGEVLDTLEGSPFRVLTTPGHTPGGVCYYDETDKVLLTGDTLFAGAIGRSDLIGGDYDHLIISIMDKLMGLPGDVDVLPGHGRKTTIADERTHNPFLQPFNEPEEDLDWDGEGIEIEGEK